MARLLLDARVRELLSLRASIEIVQRALTARPREDEASPGRQVSIHGELYNTSPGATPGTYGVSTTLVDASGPRLCVLLYDADHPGPVALVEARWLRHLATAAATAVATTCLAREGATIVGLFGSGVQAELQVLALDAVRDLTIVKVFSRRRQALHDFCLRMNAYVRAELVPMTHPEAVVKGSDLLITATVARTPLFPGMLLSPGVHVSAVGANTANRRELDAGAIARTSLIAVDSLDRARTSAGDLLLAEKDGVDPWGRTVELSDILTGAHPGRARSEDITLFKPVGSEEALIALAEQAFHLALAAGDGQDIPVIP